MVRRTILLALLSLPVCPDVMGSERADWSMGPFVKREEPILRPTPDSRFLCPVRGKEVRWEEQNTYNPAAVVRDGKIYLFYRADDKSPDLKWGRTCRIGMATSEDGIHFKRHPTPVVYPDNDAWKEYEWEGGCEDLHIIEGEDGTYYMNYTTWSGTRDTLSVATSRDLIHWKKHGPAFRKAGKVGGRSGVVVSRLEGDRLLAARIHGKYLMYYTHPCALAWSDNLIDWTPAGKSVWPGSHEAGAIALLRDEGILLMFNATIWPDRGIWTLGQARIDRKDFTSVLKHQDQPFLYAEREWEKRGFIERTTVANTLVPFKGKWLLYYGAADRCIGLAVFTPEPDSPFAVTVAGSPATRGKGDTHEQAGGKSGVIDLHSLLADMLDRSRIAEFPEPEFVCKQASSYNRRSKTPGTPEWFTGADFCQFYGSQEVDGRTEWFLLDVDGPGVVTRWWQTQFHGAGTIRIYLDGEADPIFEGPGDKLVGGDGITGPPLAAIRGRGRNLYLPIPFREHCRITYEGPNAGTNFKNESLFYAINYLQYPAGTEVKTLTRSDLEANRELTAKVGRELLNPGKNCLPIDRRVNGGKESLAPGQTLVRKVTGKGAIALFRLKLSAKDIAQAMRSTVIRASFDGKETVWAPVGEFFGSGLGIHPFQDWWRKVEKDGWMTCWWPMPFKESAEVSVTNFGTEEAVVVELADLGIAPWKWTDRTMYFHSAWRGENLLEVVGSDFENMREWNFISIEGRGVYVGDSLSLYNRPRLKWRLGPWWGEGDEHIYVDGEPFPSHFGTGSEDYYGYAFNFTAPFEAPFHAQPIAGGNWGIGHTTNGRVRVHDRIPFKTKLQFDMELFHWQPKRKIDYATTTHWYAFDGATDNRQVAPDKVREKVAQLWVGPDDAPATDGR